MTRMGDWDLESVGLQKGNVAREERSEEDLNYTMKPRTGWKRLEKNWGGCTEIGQEEWRKLQLGAHGDMRQLKEGGKHRRERESTWNQDQKNRTGWRHRACMRVRPCARVCVRVWRGERLGKESGRGLEQGKF